MPYRGSKPAVSKDDIDVRLPVPRAPGTRLPSRHPPHHCSDGGAFRSVPQPGRAFRQFPAGAFAASPKCLRAMTRPTTLHLLRSMPIWPLLATLAVQTLATMALYSVPTVAPEVARDMHVSGTLVGGFVATAYGVGILSALISPGLVRRYGGVRATQAVLLAAAGMLALVGLASGVFGLAMAAIVLGLGYGAAAPASTHLLVPQTPRPVFNLVMSVRQIGVPLGGVLAALILPALSLAIGWRAAILLELGPVLLLIALMEIPRRRWDSDREPNRRAFGRTLLQPFALLRDQRFRRLSAAAFVYSGLALCLVAFMTVHLTTTAGLDLVRAGGMLADPAI